MPAAVPIKVVDEYGTPVRGMVAVSYWLEPSGRVAKVVEYVPIQIGVGLKVAKSRGGKSRGGTGVIRQRGETIADCPQPVGGVANGLAECVATTMSAVSNDRRIGMTACHLAAIASAIAMTVAFVQSFKPDDIDGSEDRDINLTLGEHTMSFKGQPYLVHFVMPNFYFHCTTAYDILRHCDVELGKRDFIGAN